MKSKWICVLVLAALLAMSGLVAGCSSDSQDGDASAEQSDTRTVIDDDGNEITIPADVERVAPLIGAFAQITEMLTQGGGKIVAAATSNISDDFRAVFTDYDESNPDNARDSGSVEDLIASGAQVVYGPASNIFSEEQLAQLDEAGIIVVNINNYSTVEGMCSCIEKIGQILGDEEYARALEFVEYYQASLEDSAAKVSDLSDDEKVTALQINVSGGMYTCTNSSDISNEYYTAAGAINVAADYTGVTDSGTGLTNTVDAEQIVEWNPQFIITMSESATEAILSDSALANVDAVVNGNVYTCPQGLYLWCVRSGEGAMMTPWLGTLFYPDRFSDVDMTEVVQSFYSDWYNYDLSEEDAEAILSSES